MYQKFDKMREVEKEISQLKDEKFHDLTKPVDAFITFEEEDGSIIGQNYEAEFNFFGKRLPAKTKFLGTEFFLTESTEPTNIIWENRHWTPSDYIRRGAIVFTIITILILASFGLIFWCKQYSIKIFAKYPQVECSTIEKSYVNANGTDILPFYARREWDDFYKSAPGVEPTPFAGALQCYCERIRNTTNLYNFETDDGTPLCRDYFLDYWISFGASNAVQYMIVCINYVLRLVII